MFTENTYWYIVRKIAEKFKEYRNKSGLSLRDIYEDKKISSMAVVSELENGKKLPKLKTLLKLMSLVEIPFDEVFSSNVLPTKATKKQSGNTVSKSDDDEMRDTLMAHGYDSKEIDDILKYMNYVKSQRA